MPLQILERVGIAICGAAIHKVRCTLCGDVYRVTGERGHIGKARGCATCAHALLKVPNRQAGVNRRRRLRYALRAHGFALTC